MSQLGHEYPELFEGSEDDWVEDVLRPILGVRHETGETDDR
jgi:hypothetical protein